MMNSKVLIRKIIMSTKSLDLKWKILYNGDDNIITYSSIYNITKNKKIILKLEKIKYKHNGEYNMWFQYEFISNNKLIMKNNFFYKEYNDVMLLYGYIKFINIAINPTVTKKNYNKVGKLSNYINNLKIWTKNNIILWEKHENSYILKDINIGRDEIFLQIFENRFFVKRKMNKFFTDQIIIIDITNNTLFKLIDNKM